MKRARRTHSVPDMALCRVDPDRLRGLASQLGNVAVVLDDAAPAATVLNSHGFAGEASHVAATLLAGTVWAGEWSASLVQRAELVDADRTFFAVPAWTTDGVLRRTAAHSTMATHVARPSDVDGAIAVDDERLGAAVFRLASAERPAAVATAFASIDPKVAVALAAGHPELVGPLGGAPRDLRFTANRILLDRTIAATHAALGRAAGMAWLDLAVQLAALERLALRDPALLTFDWEAGRIVEWIGPRHAGNVAVYVPGAMVSRLDFPDLAADVAVLTELDAGGGDLAVIAALTYTAPPTVLHGVLGSYADSGGAELVQLISGLDVAGRHVSIVGHSYGTVVIGEALRSGLAGALPPGFDVVVLGSPGVRADHVAQLGVDPQHFWAALLPGDEIGAALHPSEVLRRAACATSGIDAVAPWCGPSTRLLHGVNPAHPSFGARVFPVGGDGRGGHSDYLATSLQDGAVVPSLVVAELVRILAGSPPPGL